MLSQDFSDDHGLSPAQRLHMCSPIISGCIRHLVGDNPFSTVQADDKYLSEKQGLSS